MTDIFPTLAILASALKLEHLTDGSMQRAADNALSHAATQPLYEFDGTELRIISESERDAGVWIVTDGVVCTCKGGRHPMCKHRALFRLLLAREVLLDPLFLKIHILEQVAPAQYLDAGDAWGDEDAPPAILAPQLDLADDDWFSDESAVDLGRRLCAARSRLAA